MKKIKYLGPEGSYSEIAAQKYWHDSADSLYDLLPLPSIKDVVEQIDLGQDDIGIIPIENSIEGTVRESIDTLIHFTKRVYIVKEIVLPIKHCLITLAQDLNEIKTLVTHPQALAQCSDFIHKNLNSTINKIIVQSTSGAIKQISEYNNPSYAAIGNENGALKYHVPVLKANINNYDENKTRFFVISNNLAPYQDHCKSSIIFATVNEAGALVTILNIFAKHTINLLHIESRPSKKSLGDYLFFIEFEGHKEDKNVKKALEKCVSNINFYKFLGSYTVLGAV